MKKTNIILTVLPQYTDSPTEEGGRGAKENPKDGRLGTLEGDNGQFRVKRQPLGHIT